MPVLLRTNEAPPTYIFWCPACKHGHSFRTEGPEPRWTFNGDMEKPTVNPSILLRGGSTEIQCHFYLIDGFFQYSSDCAHELASKKVPMVDWDSLGAGS